MWVEANARVFILLIGYCVSRQLSFIKNNMSEDYEYNIMHIINFEHLQTSYYKCDFLIFCLFFSLSFSSYSFDSFWKCEDTKNINQNATDALWHLMRLCDVNFVDRNIPNNLNLMIFNIFAVFQSCCVWGEFLNETDRKNLRNILTCVQNTTKRRSKNKHNWFIILV